MTDCDVVVIGAGPAGLQAAMQAARKKAVTVVAGKASGSSLKGTVISNYLGTGTVKGEDLLAEGRAQAEAAGAVLKEQNVISARMQDGLFVLGLEDGEELVSRSVVLATGISRQKLGVPGEKELYGKGVSYCAVCDCNFYRGKKVAVVGNDSEAAVSAELMTGYASEVHWVRWEDGADPYLVEKARAAGVTEEHSRPVSIDPGENGKVSAVSLEDGRTIAVDGVFIELGARSSADLAMDLGAMPETDDTLKVGADCSTPVPGLYACGDITGRPWQVAKAVGQGCVAGMAAADHARGTR